MPVKTEQLDSPMPQRDVQPIATILPTNPIPILKATSKPRGVFSSRSLPRTLKPWVMLGFDSTQRTHPSQAILASPRVEKKDAITCL